MKILYFAWVRQKVGLAEEVVSPPGEVCDVAGRVQGLCARSPGHAAAIALPKQVRAAVNQEFAGPDALVAADDEVAFFPPVTGG